MANTIKKDIRNPKNIKNKLENSNKYPFGILLTLIVLSVPTAKLAADLSFKYIIGA